MSNNWPVSWNEIKSTLTAELNLYCASSFGAVRNKFSFANRDEKLYMTITGDPDVIKYGGNSELWRQGLYRIVDNICPESRMTSGGVNQFTFRLNKDLPSKNKKMKKDVYVSQKTVRMMFSDLLNNFRNGTLSDGNYILVLDDNSLMLFDSVHDDPLANGDFMVYSFIKIHVNSK